MSGVRIPKENRRQVVAKQRRRGSGGQFCGPVVYRAAVLAGFSEEYTLSSQFGKPKCVCCGRPADYSRFLKKGSVRFWYCVGCVCLDAAYRHFVNQISKRLFSSGE